MPACIKLEKKLLQRQIVFVYVKRAFRIDKEISFSWISFDVNKKQTQGKGCLTSSVFN